MPEPQGTLAQQIASLRNDLNTLAKIVTDVLTAEAQSSTGTGNAAPDAAGDEWIPPDDDGLTLSSWPAVPPPDTASSSKKEDPQPKAWVDYASADEWVELCDWVDWLISTYNFSSTHEIRACWPAHLGVAEELAALRKSWIEVAREARLESTPGDGPAHWHDRVLAPFLGRVNQQYGIGLCRNRKHENPMKQSLTDRTLVDVRSAADPKPEPTATGVPA